MSISSFSPPAHEVNWNSISSNVKVLVKDITQASAQKVPIPSIGSKVNFFYLINQKHCNLDGSYKTDFWDPAYKYLAKLEDWEFRCIENPSQYVEYLKNQGHDEQAAWNMAREYENAHNIAQIMLQHSHNFEWEKTCALQQMVCDMWNTFVKSSGFCTTSHCLPPIAKWAVDRIGPWALSNHFIKKEAPIEMRQITGENDAVPIVSFPSNYSAKGILSWTVLAHEIAHTILETNPSAKNFLSRKIKKDIEQGLCDFPAEVKTFWADYWGNRITEIGADVIAVLYMGPAAAIGLMAFFRSFRQNHKLSNSLDVEDTHPADILRGLLMAYVVSYLDISESAKKAWADYLIHEVEKDLVNPDLTRDWNVVKYCAQQVAYTVTHTPIIGRKSLKGIKCWNDEDEDLVAYYLGDQKVKKELIHYEAPHIIAGANLYLLLRCQLQSTQDEVIAKIFNQMTRFLYEEGQLRAKNQTCPDCPLTQKTIRQYCPAPLQTETSPLTKAKRTKRKPKIDPLDVAAAGVLGVGTVAAIGLLAFAIFGKK